MEEVDRPLDGLFVTKMTVNGAITENLYRECRAYLSLSNQIYARTENPTRPKITS